MTMLKTLTYDIAERLRTPGEMALYLDACIEESNGDATFIAKALGDIARAQGMNQVVRQSALPE
jgi:probable addiction module antidote protein